MSNFVTHESCPQCGSKDNVAVYDDGFKECMSVGCDYIVRSRDYSPAKNSKKSYSRVSLPTTDVLNATYFTPETIEAFKVGTYLDENNKTWVVFPTYVDNIPVGYKKRLFKEGGRQVWQRKDFRWGEGGTKPGLFGMQSCRGKDSLIITEGEFDAMAAYQMNGYVYDVVSITKGAPSAVNCIKDHIEFIKSYKEIVICFDNDEPGEQAADEVIKILPGGRAKLATLPVKDAFDMLKEKRDKDFRQYIKGAKMFAPTTLLTGKALAQEALRRLTESAKKGIDTGYPSLNKLCGGFKPGEIVTIVAGTGVGKTTFTLNLSYNIIKNGNPTLFMPLEMSLDNILSRYYELDTGRAIYTPDGVNLPNDYQEVIDGMADNIVVFDHIGSVDMEKILDDIRFAASAYDVNCIVLDHKDAAMATLNEGTSDYRAIDNLMGQLKKVAIETGVCIILVTHQSRSSDDKEDNKASLSRVRGSQGVAQNSDMVLGLERQRDSHVTKVKTLKAHRLIGKYGDFELLYDASTKRMKEIDMEGYEQQDNKVERNNIQVNVGNGGSQTQPVSTVRTDEGGVQETVHPRLHSDNEVGTRNSPRSEGLLQSNRQDEDEASEVQQPRTGHTDNASETDDKTGQEEQDNVRQVVREERLPMVSSPNHSLGMDEPLIALDLETAGFIENGEPPTIVCYSVCNEEMSYVVQGTDGLGDLLTRYVPVFHNASFDVAVLRGHGFKVDKYHDTMLLANTINSNREVGLDALCQELWITNAKIKFDMKAWKKAAFPYTEELKEYAKRDTQATWELWWVLLSQANESQYKLYYEQELPYCEAVMEMQDVGFKLDKDKAIEFAFDLSVQMNDIKNQILQQFPVYPTEKTYKREHEDLELLRTQVNDEGQQEYVYRTYVPFNPGSGDHKTWSLMQQGWKPTEFNKKSGKPKLDDGIISELQNKYPIAKLYSEYSKLKKLHSSFAKPFIEKVDDQDILRGSFNQAGTVTGRLSSSNPNMQNIPASGIGGEIRGLLGVREGKKLVGGDLSNIEARILAHYLEVAFKDSTMANAFRNGLDLHWENAKAWGVAVDPNTDNPKKDPGRSIAKTMLYLIMYGGSYRKLADNLGISEKEAEKHFATFEKNCPSMDLLKRSVWSTLRKRGYIKTLLGRHLEYPNVNSKNKSLASRAERQSFNALIQGSAADIFKDLSVKTQPICEKYGARFVASVHDETLFECPEEHAEEFAKEVTEVWSNQSYLCIPVTAEFAYGDNWNSVK